MIRTESDIEQRNDKSIQADSQWNTHEVYKPTRSGTPVERNLAKVMFDGSNPSLSFAYDSLAACFNHRWMLVGLVSICSAMALTDNPLRRNLSASERFSDTLACLSLS